MGRIIETTIDRFDGGIVNDPRDPREATARMVTNFDIITNPKRMTPYRSSESGDENASTSEKKNFCIALRTGTTYSLYGLGVVSGTARAEINYKNLTTGAATDLDDSAWAATANNASASGTTNTNLFVFYKLTGLIYGAKAGQYIWAYDPTGSAAFAETHRDLTSFTTIGQGLVHSKDDILYIPYDNKIAKNNNGTWTNAALTLPAHYVITSICEYGNFLAIGVAPLSGIGHSRVYLWNRDSSLTTLSESVDWGVGTLKILEEVDGALIGISQKGGTSTSGIPTIASASFRDRIIFRYLTDGNRSEKFKEYTGGGNTTILPIAKEKVDNRLYFMMQITFNGAVREGVWSMGRSAPGQPFALVHERTPNNDTALASSSNLHNFITVGDYIFISYTSGGTVGLSKTDDGATYSHSSIYESKRFGTVDSSMKKDLVGVTVMHEYLPAAGQVIMKYRKDEETSWTTILTNTTDNSISKSAVNIESSGAALPKDYKEIEFRVESTGGAEITGFSFSEEVTGKKAYG